VHQILDFSKSEDSKIVHLMQLIPVRITVPENSLQSFLTIANPMPLLAPVTYKINNLKYNYTGVDLSWLSGSCYI